MGDKFYPQQRGGCSCWDVLLPLEKRNKSEKKFPGPTHDGTVFPDEKWWVKFGPRRWRWGCVLVLYHLQFCQDRAAAAAGENTYFFICLQTPSPQSSDPDTVHSLNTPNLHIHTFHLPSASIVELVLFQFLIHCIWNRTFSGALQDQIFSYWETLII